MADNNQTPNPTKQNETNNPSSENKKESKSTTIGDVLGGIVGAVAGAVAGGGVSNPFSGSDSNAESVSSGNSSIRSTLNSTPSGGDSGIVGENRANQDNSKESSAIEVLSKIHKVLSETNATVNQIHKDTVALTKNKSQQDVSSDIQSINARARQNETSGSRSSSPVFLSAPNRKKEEEDSSILGSIADWFTGGKKQAAKQIAKGAAKGATNKATKGAVKQAEKEIAEEAVDEVTKGTAKKVQKEIVKNATEEVKEKAPSAADKIVSKINKKGIVESTKDALKDAFSGWGKKEAEKGTAKKVQKEIAKKAPSTAEKVEEKGMWDKLKDAFTGPKANKAKKIAGGAAIGGAAASIPGDTSDEYLKTLGMSESGGDPNIGAKTSGAVGLFQFIPGTWESVTQQMGKNYSLEDRKDPKKAEEVARVFTELNRKDFIKRNKREPTDKELHMSHFLGSPGSAQLSSANPDESAAKVAPDAAKSNKPIFYKGYKPKTKNSPEILGTPRTTQEVIDLMGQRYDKKLELVRKGKVPETIKNIGSDKKDNSIGNIPPLNENNTSSPKPEITGKNGKQVPLTGDTNRNPYFGKESTPYDQAEEETASPFIHTAYNPDSEPAGTFSGAQFPNNESKPKQPAPTTEDNSKYAYYKDSNGKNVKENMETGEETSADDESGKLDAPKSMIRQVKLANGETKNWKVDLESGEETLATEDDINQDKQQKELEKQYDEKQQSSSSPKTEAKNDRLNRLSYTVETPGENSKVTTTKGSSSKSPGEFRNASETTTVTTTGGGSTLHVQEQSEEEKAKLAKEEAHERELEKKYEGVYKTDSLKASGNKKPTATPLSKKEQDMLKEVDSLDAQNAKLKAERDAEPSYKDYGDDKESMDKDLNRLSENYAKQHEVDDKRNAIIGTPEYMEARKKQKGQSQAPAQQPQPPATPAPMVPERGTSGGNDDPTIKLMEEGIIA